VAALHGGEAVAGVEGVGFSEGTHRATG
jgi:hypothetical protein